MRRARWIALAVAIAALSVPVWFAQRSAREAVHRDEAARGIDEEAPGAAAGVSESPARASSTVASDGPAPATLFDHDRPLAERIAELDARARRGEAAAGCQLGVELLRCERARQLEEHAEDLLARVTANGSRQTAGPELDARIDAALQRRDLHRRIRQLCEGISVRDYEEPARYLYPAGQAGHLPAMRLLLGANLYEPDALFRDPGLVGLLRDIAPRYFATLLGRGDLALLDRWSVIGLQTDDPLRAALPPPWNRTDLAHAVRTERALRHPPPNPRPWTDDRPPALREEAARVYERYFAAEAARAAQAAAPPRAEFGDLSHYECEEAGR